MVVFLDTSAIYALANADDPNHPVALRRFGAALEDGVDLLVHSYILVETFSLLRARGGWEAVSRFLAAPVAFRLRWVNEGLHRAALRRFRERQARFSLVDEVSFLVMEEEGVVQALAFDRDFVDQGFVLYSGS